METRKFKNKLVIGISGKKGNGKDTVADFLQNNYHFQKIALATPLKQITEILFGVKQDQLTDPLYKEARLVKYNMSPRELMQVIGTDIFRERLPSIWVDVATRNIEESSSRLFVIPDIRFENEAEVCDYVIRVNREGLSINKDTHISENALDNYPFEYIINNETNKLYNTYKQVEDVIKEILDKEGVTYYA